MQIIDNINKQEQTNILARYLPNDRLYQSKNIDGSNLRAILISLACGWLELNNNINKLFTEYNPIDTTDFINEWESQVGIPDDCFSKNGSIEERRTNILLKIAGLNISTEQQFLNLAQILGVNLTIKIGKQQSLVNETIPFIISDSNFLLVVTIRDLSRNAIVGQTIPFIIGSDTSQVIQCLFEKLIPCNCKLIFKFDN